MEDEDTTALQFELKGLTNYTEFLGWENLTKTFMPDLVRNYNFELMQTRSTAYLQFRVLAGETKIMLDGSRYIETFEVRTYKWTEEMYDLLYNLPSFDRTIEFKSNDRILIIPRSGSIDTASIIENRSITIIADSLQKPVIDQSVYANYSLPITYAFRPLQIDMEYVQENDLSSKINLHKGYLFTEDAVDLWYIYDRYNSTKPPGYFNPDLLTGETDVFVKIPKLADFDIDQFQANLAKLERDAQAWIYSLIDVTRIDIVSPLQDALEEYQIVSSPLTVRLILISGPLAGLALFLVYFSLSLVEQRKMRLITVMKLRGTSRDQLRVMFIAEVIVSALIAIFAGMLLSIPWTKLSLKTSGFFEFKGETIPISIPSNWFWLIPSIAMILALNLNIFSVLSLSRIRIEEKEEEKSVKQRPFWQKIHGDIIVFLLTVFYWLMIHFYTFDDVETYEFLVEALGPLMIIIFFIGSTLITARYFGDFVGYLSNIIWKIQGGFIALATRNMRKNKFTASRLAALLLMGMMLSLISISVSTSYIEFEKNNARYELAADIYVDGIDPNDEELWSLLDVNGTEGATGIVKTELFIYDRGRLSKANILGVNLTEFSEIAFWENVYANHTLEEMSSQFTKNLDIGLTERTNNFGSPTHLAFCNRSLEEINDDLNHNITGGLNTDCRKDLWEVTSALTQNVSIAVQSTVLDTFKIEVGERYFIPLAGGGYGRTVTFNVVDQFDYFPNLVTELPVKDQDGEYTFDFVPMLVDIRIARILGDISDKFELGAYIKVSDTANMTQVMEDLRFNFLNYTAITFQSIDEFQEDVFDSDEAKIFIFALQGMLVVTLATTVIAVAYFSYITLADRKNEIGILRAMGMVRRQIFYLLLMESLTILIFALLFGGLMGIFLSYNLFVIIIGQSIASTVPPFKAATPWGLIGIFSMIISVLSVISAAIPALLTANRQTGSILRVE
jgi:ABC-type antimicrobial peptide transport system permease subunit